MIQEQDEGRQGSTRSKYWKTSTELTPPCDLVKVSDDENQRKIQDLRKVGQKTPPSLKKMPLPTSSRLTKVFYNKSSIALAKALLGKRLVRMVDSKRISGTIVETEAYAGLIDKAAHSYQGKRTDRNEAMFMEPGTAYVYNIYGMYCCFNISSQGDGEAVLIRALEAVEGKSLMTEARSKKGTGKVLKDKDLTNGPSKLCQALYISKAKFNKVDLVESETMWLEPDVLVQEKDIVCCPRINIGYAEDWVEKNLRFYILGNAFVSVRNKTLEPTTLSKTAVT